MELAPRYCRTCGSRILVKNVCHNCNNDPLKGDNYCYDCGALTPNADSCLKCGARYKRSSHIKLLLTIGGLLFVAIAVAGYFLSRPDKPSSVQQENSLSQSTSTVPDTNKQELSHTHDTIVNNPVDTSSLINAKPADTTINKPPAKDTTKKIASNIFTSEERKAYSIRCSYFRKNQRSQVLFFIAGGSGYIKMNDKTVELKRKSKGVDVAVFGNDNYEAVIRIDGLSGSAKEWLASCTFILKDLLQHTSATYKVYSACIEL
ncbi:MAG TPA: zinc ribbon domain-containing protein [Chitinophagaceae bacterium]|nr:zinc ribbon domain-containing protein [Chitinophagaceae bacterium]